MVSLGEGSSFPPKIPPSSTVEENKEKIEKKEELQRKVEEATSGLKAIPPISSFSSSSSSSSPSAPLPIKPLSRGPLRIVAEGGGYVHLEILPDEIHISHLDCSSSQGKGVGTGLIRQVMKLAFDHGISKVTATASWKSNQHIFHLKMGMIPDERPFPYVEHFYGRSGVNAIQHLRDGSLEEEDFPILERILRKEENKPKTAIISEEEILEKTSFLIGLLDRTCSYRKDLFLNTLLDFLEANKKSPSPFPDSSLFGPVNMTMSEQGRERWKRDIMDGGSFSSFHEYEHLRPFMSESQIKRLEAIL